MNVVIGILTGVEVIVAILLIGIILLQPSKSGGGLGSVGGGVTEQVFGATAGSVLTKITVWLSAIFMAITLVLVVLGSHRQSAATKSVVEEYATAKTAAKAKTTGTAAVAGAPLITTTAAVQAKAVATTTAAVQTKAVATTTAAAVAVPVVPAAPAKP